MTLNYFSNHTQPDGKRYDAVNCVRGWLAGKAYLPKDLKAALQYLIPELEKEKAGAVEEWD